MKPITIHSEAIEELDEAVAYYEDQKAGLGLDFLVKIEQALDKIQRNPNLGSRYKIPGIRRYVIQRFPFLVFYTELEECIWVIAIAHGTRRPDYWKRRQIG